MNKINILCKNNEIREIVKKAFIRSFNNLVISDKNNIDNKDINVIVNPKEKITIKGKVIIFGKIEPSIFNIVEKNRERVNEIIQNSNKGYRHSNLYIKYKNNEYKRYFFRYDFTDEWNNASYGKIDGFFKSIYSIPMKTTQSEYSIASIYNEYNEFISEYACIKDDIQGSVLWFNREVGPIDSFEWSIIEDFICNYRADDLICLPCILDIPAEYDSLVTMRLDCDQDVASAKKLCEMYFDEKVPMTLALNTSIVKKKEDFDLINKVILNNGAVVSHSQNHFPNWGGSYLGAKLEALGSRFWIENNILKKKRLKYVVSPFHQNPQYAVQAMCDCGYKGFIGGIIHNDPEYLMARAGVVPFVENIVSLSQQCMLHGDCYHNYGSSINVYEETYNKFLLNNSIFGYLDHPFSKEYQYGWLSEDERINVHQSLIKYIKNKSKSVGFWNIEQVLDWIVKKSQIRFILDFNKIKIEKKHEIYIKYKFKNNIIIGE